MKAMKYNLPEHTDTGIDLANSKKDVQSQKRRVLFTCLKLVAGVVIFVLGAALLFRLYETVNNYLQYPIQTNVKFEMRNDLHFPAVTVCNENPLRLSKVHLGSGDLQLLVSMLSNDTAQNSGDDVFRNRYAHVLSQLNSSGIELHDHTVIPVADDNEIDSRERIGKLFTRLYQRERREVQRIMGHQLTTMLMSCKLGKHKCNQRNFTIVSHHTNGNCFSIQSNDFKISREDANKGISIVLYTEDDEYILPLSEAGGVRVFIHEQETLPFSEDQGFTLSSSSETQIGIRMVEEKRIQEPFSRCTEDNYSEKYGFRYTDNLCFSLCKRKHIISKCGCVAPEHSTYDWLEGNHTKQCQSNAEYACIRKEEELDLYQKDCRCDPQCLELQFVKTISTRRWPSDDLLRTLKNVVCERLPEKCNTSKSTTTGPEGLKFLKVVIYFEDFNVLQFAETPEMDLSTLLSDLSIIVVFLIFLSYLMFMLCCDVNKCKYKEKT